jgi:transmembrane sensor
VDQNSIDSDLLARYVSGEADDAQRARVASWAAMSASNAKELEHLDLIWGWGSEAGPEQDWDEQDAWVTLEKRIAEAEGRGRVIPVRRIRWQRWAAAAAIVTGVLLTARWFVRPTADHYASTNVVLQATLKDSSSVVLSPGSAIVARIGRERSITLKGEAYFAVQRDEARPFVVEADEVDVTVLGTAFTVSAFDTADMITVRVRHGRVEVRAGDDTLVLSAGEHARYSKSRHLLERAPAPPAEVWGWRILHFDSAPLHEVIRQLERIYKVRISLKHEGLANCSLTAEFDDEPIESILRVIADTFGLQLTSERNNYELDGQGC